MKSYLLALSCTLLTTSVFAGASEDFAVCAKESGANYVAARERLLAAGDGADVIQAKLASTAWRERLAAKILQGWQKQAADYRKMLTAEKVKDQRQIERYAWAVDKQPIAVTAVPLMYEIMLKDAGNGDAWDGAIALVNLAKKTSDTPLDIRVLHQFLQTSDEATPVQREAIAWLLGALPASYQESDDLLGSLKAELQRPQAERQNVEALLRALAKSAAGQSAAHRDVLFARVLELKSLPHMLGEVAFTYAVGGIGGDKASQQVVAYLERSPQEIEKRWALQTLAQSDSLIGTRELLKYADDKRDKLRATAIAGLAQAPYLPEVGAKLETLAMSDTLPQAQQLAAVRSLATISARVRNNPDLRRQIDARLQTISAGKRDPDIKAEIDELIQGLQTP